MRNGGGRERSALSALKDGGGVQQSAETPNVLIVGQMSEPQEQEDSERDASLAMRYTCGDITG